MNSIIRWIEVNLGISPALQNRVIDTVLAIALIWLVKVLAMRLVRRWTDRPQTRYSWRKATTYAASILIILAVARVWLGGLESLVTYLGLVSAGLAIALREPLVNLVGWMFILWRRPFRVGDRVEVLGVRGDVVDVSIFQFSLLELGNWVDADQTTGRIIRIPNGKVFTDSLANYSDQFDYVWNEIPVLVTFESDWKLAKKILTDVVENRAGDAAKSAAREIAKISREKALFLGGQDMEGTSVYSDVRDSGVMLTLRYPCPPKERRKYEHEIWEDILDRFAAEDSIDFAYPTTRFYRMGEPKNGESGSKNI